LIRGMRRCRGSECKECKEGKEKNIFSEVHICDMATFVFCFPPWD
jgi:hypothetical protein